jgi:hypothetical protein
MGKKIGVGHPGWGQGVILTSIGAVHIFELWYFEIVVLKQ